ncbi:Uncharacterised protein r2_g944 [Pycnogonum litorale]
MIKKILSAYHNEPMGGHLGEKKVLSRITERYVRPGMRKDIRKVCKDCHLCAVAKDYGANKRTPLEPIAVEHLRPFQKVNLDLIGPLPEARTGEKWVIVCVDYFTKWPIVGALKSTESAEIIRWFRDNVLTNFGVPEELVWDLGDQLTSSLFEDFLKNSGIRHCKSAPFKPSTNGLVERYNRSLMNALRCFAQEEPEM